MKLLQFLCNHLIKHTKRHYSYKWSYVSGPSELPLIGTTLGKLIDISGDKFENQIALTSVHQGSNFIKMIRLEH